MIVQPYRLALALACVVAVLSIPGAAFAEAPEPDPQEPSDRETGWTPEAIQGVKVMINPRLSPDGTRVAFAMDERIMTASRSETLTHIWTAAVSADGPESPVQFTFGDDSARAPQWSPDGRWLAFTSRRSGKSNLWLMAVDGGESWRLTDVATGVGTYAFSPDGSAIAFAMNEERSKEQSNARKAKDDARVVGAHPRRSHLWMVTLPDTPGRTVKAKRLTEGEFTVAPRIVAGFDWAPDGSAIAFTHTPDARADLWPQADISVVDVESGEIRPLLTTSAVEASPKYSPDGNSLVFQRSDDPPTWGFTADFWIVDAEGGEPRPLAATHDSFFSTLLGFTKGGDEVIYMETEGTLSRVAALPVDGGPARILETGRRFISSAALSKDGSQIVMVAEDVGDPQRVLLAGVDDFAPRPVSPAQADLPDHPLPRTEVITWKGPGGLDVEGLLTYPVGYTEGERHPLVLVIHGGPAGNFNQRFIASSGVFPLAAFAQRGFAVLRPNPRGSAGYGREFRYANYEDWGGGDYGDLMAGVDEVIERGIADPERLGVMGWSYGGFMTAWIITQTDRFKAATIGAAVTHLQSFSATTDVPGFIPDYMGGEWWETPEIYRQRSPLLHADKVTTPALILHGERDNRVPVSQGHELHHALERRGVETQMVVYPRTGHGLREPKLRLDAMHRNLDWFARHVLGEAPSPGDDGTKVGED